MDDELPGASAPDADVAEAADLPADADVDKSSSGKRRTRPHPYAKEASTDAESRLSPRLAAGLVLGVSTVVLIVGLWAQTQFGYLGPDTMQHANWESWTRIPLFAGLGLLGVGLMRRPWAQPLAMLGWLLFGVYWAMTARDLLVREGQDYVNFVFAMAGVYLTSWLAYHNWLDQVRGKRDDAVRFLQVGTFVAAGFYFLVDKIQFMRVGLIHFVSDHTKWMLDLFGQGSSKGLVFLVDEADNKSPTTFFYPEIYCEGSSRRLDDDVAQYCTDIGVENRLQYADQLHPPANWFEQMLQYAPDGDLAIVPVSIILACTALQSIMLFVGLFAGTRAPWQKIVKASLVVGLMVYVLNLVRNTGIIWFYGQGYASFWVMHNAIGKGGSLIAILAIAVGVFKYFPEFLKALIGVLDLIDRDGPLERALRLGRRRPEAA